MSPRNGRWDETSRLGDLGEARMRRMRASKAECKTDQWATTSGSLFVETESWSRTTQRYEPSGIRHPDLEAEHFWFIIGGTPDSDEPGDVAIVLSRQRLLRLCEGLPITAANKKGDNPTRGYLLPLAKVVPTGVAQYRVIPCPECRNVVFRFAGRWSDDGSTWLEDYPAKRECHGPRGCGHVWDAGEAGREIVAWRRFRS